MALMLAMGYNEQQKNWDAFLAHAKAASNNSINASTGLAPNEVHVSRLPCVPLSVFNPPDIGGHQSLDRDHLAYCKLATERQQHTYRLVREVHNVTVSRLAHRESPILGAHRLSPPYAVGSWAWVYNSAATINQGAKKGTDAIVLKTKFSLN